MMKKLLFCTTAAAVLACFPAYSQDPELIACWDFNSETPDTTTDSVNGHEGELLVPCRRHVQQELEEVPDLQPVLLALLREELIDGDENLIEHLYVVSVE